MTKKFTINSFVSDKTKVFIKIGIILFLLMFNLNSYSQITCSSVPELDLGEDTVCYYSPFLLDASNSYTSYSWQDGSINSTYSVNGPGMYIVEIIDTLGNVLTNGDFELGNNGFYSDYIDSTFSSDLGLFPEAVYAISNDAQEHHPYFSNCTDHTTGSGNMMVVNGSPNANDNVWCQTIAVSPNTNYIFSAWVSTVEPQNPSSLQFSIDGIPLGSVFNSSGIICNWEQFYEVWNSGSSTSITICITNQNTIFQGNDFALDDISFSPICVQTDTVLVVAPPVASFTSQDVCHLNTTLFENNSISNTGNIINNSWTFGDGGTSGLVSPSYIYVNSGNYGVQLLVETDFGCVDSVTNISNVYDLPIAAFSSDVVCANQQTSFTDQSVGLFSIVSWGWNLGSSTSNSQNPVNTFPNGGTYPISLQVTDINGCSNDTVQNVNVDYTPQVGFSTSQVCGGDSVQFADASVVVNSSLDTWSWDFGDGTNSNVQNPSHLYSSFGGYNVTLTATSQQGCVNSGTQSIVIAGVPSADFSANSSCLGSTTIFNDLSQTNIVSWNWTFGDNQNSSVQHPTNIYQGSGNFDVLLVVQDINGCVDSIMKSVTIFPLPNLSIDSFTDGCAPLPIELIASSTSSISEWSWSISDGTTSNTQNISTTLFDEGSYDVSLSVTDVNGCVNTINEFDYLIVYPNPVAEFIMDPSVTTEFDPTVNFTDLSSNDVVLWDWNFGDGNFSSTQNAINTYGGVGEYTVSLIVENSYGCTDEVIRKVNVKPTFSLFVPNAFTPDDDAYNNSFKAVGYGIKDFTMLIFNRWGELLFESHNIEVGWNGFYLNKMVQDGVYVWKIEVETLSGDTYKKQGHVTMLR